MFPLVRSETGLFISSTVSSIGSTILGSHAGLSCSKAPSITGFEHYPIGYSDVAKQFGVRPATLFQKIRRTVAKLPEQLRPKRILFWDVKPETSLGTFRMAIEKLSDIPADRPLTLAERKALLKEMQDARGRLICAESILEVAIEGCKDELKKKELQRQLELTRKALASLTPVD